jgi:cholest-4-en-3-one 26-monooxygenase
VTEAADVDQFGAGFDFTDPDFMAQHARPQQQFAELRRTAAIWWNPQQEGRAGGFRDSGYWVVTKHADIRAISPR